MEKSVIFNWFAENGVVIAGILLVAVALYWLLGMITSTLNRQIQSLDDVEDSELDKRTETIFRVIRSTGVVLIVGTAVLMILTELGVPITPVLASIGFVGLAFGLGAQTLVQDMISGLFILIENQYTVGDAIQIDNVAGTVEELTLRTTMVRDMYGTLHVIPNGEIRVVSNKSRDWSRAVLDVGITYDDDVDEAMGALAEVGKALETDESINSLLLGPATVTGVEGLDDWAVRLRILVKTLPGQQWAVQRYMRRQIRITFDTRGIDLAFPRQDVMLIQPDE